MYCSVWGLKEEILTGLQAMCGGDHLVQEGVVQRGGRGTALGEGAPAWLWEPPLLCLKIFGFQGPDQIRDEEIRERFI